MSAYLVEENHIEYLVDAILDPQNNMMGSTQHLAGTTDAQELGQILWDQNARSVNYRYKESESSPSFTYRGKCYEYDPLQILASIRCYAYQSCETPDFTESKAGKLVYRLQASIIGNITAGKEWGSPKPKEGCVSISSLIRKKTKKGYVICS
jgi:hypothetical protein